VNTVRKGDDDDDDDDDDNFDNNYKNIKCVLQL